MPCGFSGRPFFLASGGEGILGTTGGLGLGQPGRFHEMGVPPGIHKRKFHYKSAILGYPFCFLEPPIYCIYIYMHIYTYIGRWKDGWMDG